METGPDSSSTASDEQQFDSDRDTFEQGRQIVLEEARKTANQQLAQINKVDDEALRTVRLTLVLLGLLAGGTQFRALPKLGLLGVFGTTSLVGSLVTALFIYGTSKPFIGSRLDEIHVDYPDRPFDEDAHDEIVDQYERGTVRNRRILYSNAFVLGVSRLLLGIAVVLVVFSFVTHIVDFSLLTPTLYEPLLWNAGLF